jgi:hypothetical protein
MDLIVTEKESTWVTSGGDVVGTFAIGEAIIRSIFVFDGIVMLFLGLAIVKQKNLSPIVGGLFTFLGMCVLVGGMLSEGDNWAGMIWFIGFLGFPIITAVTGILTLREARNNK